LPPDHDPVSRFPFHLNNPVCWRSYFRGVVFPIVVVWLFRYRYLECVFVVVFVDFDLLESRINPSTLLCLRCRSAGPVRVAVQMSCVVVNGDCVELEPRIRTLNAACLAFQLQRRRNGVGHELIVRKHSNSKQADTW
jgi:hypothetical protein